MIYIDYNAFQHGEPPTILSITKEKGTINCYNIEIHFEPPYSKDLEIYLVHLNNSSAFRLYDPSKSTESVSSGAITRISTTQGLVLTKEPVRRGNVSSKPILANIDTKSGDYTSLYPLLKN